MNTRRHQKFTLSIGDVARRTGLTTSALRFYEEKALIGSTRTPGNQRCYTRDVIRRVSLLDQPVGSPDSGHALWMPRSRARSSASCASAASRAAASR